MEKIGEISQLSDSGNECSICLKNFFSPIAITSCGHSFHQKCIEICKECPLCKNPINPPLARNYQLESMLNSPITLENEVSELICLDISTSMWYGDSLIPLLFGPQRIDIAKKFIEGVLKERANSQRNEVAIVTFGTQPLLLVPFQQAKPNLEIQKQKAIERKTALFDAIIYAENQLISRKSNVKRLIVLTDGVDNASNEKNIKELKDEIRSKTKSLQVLFIEIGDPNVKTKKAVEDLGFEYGNLNNNNINAFTISYLNRYPSQKSNAILIRKELIILDKMKVEDHTPQISNTTSSTTSSIISS